MIRAKEYRGGKPVIDLTGPEGNAFCLMGYAKRWAGQMGKDWDKLSEEMMGGDYEQLIGVIEREFGEYVILER